MTCELSCSGGLIGGIEIIASGSVGVTLHPYLLFNPLSQSSMEMMKPSQTHLEDGEREGMWQLSRVGDEGVGCSSVGADAEDPVHLRVHPVQTLIHHV